MDNIKNVLSDSTWWFSVVIVGLIISILANFIVIGLRRFWLKAMNKYADNINTRRKQDNEIIEKLKADKQLFIIYTLKNIFGFMSLFLFLLVGLSISIMGGGLAFLEDRDNIGVIDRRLYLLIPGLMLGFLSIIGMIVNFATSRSSKIIFTVTRFYLRSDSAS